MNHVLPFCVLTDSPVLLSPPTDKVAADIFQLIVFKDLTFNLKLESIIQKIWIQKLINFNFF